ncbi:MAG TPA: CBS domain-containing protein [Azoarcus taiwanensis]|nr:CBS domain-containing protein [Azoarcus taiwanensis]
MTNRKLALIVEHQHPLTLASAENIQRACQCMREQRIGAVMVSDDGITLKGIFTGRDAVRAMAECCDPVATPIEALMTPDPTTIAPNATAIEALRLMSDGGFRHLPVVEAGRIVGIVSRGDFKGLELDHFEDETSLWERIA